MLPGKGSGSGLPALCARYFCTYRWHWCNYQYIPDPAKNLNQKKSESSFFLEQSDSYINPKIQFTLL